MLIVYPTSNINTPTISSTTTVLVANTKRIGWGIQNLGTNPLFVLLGSGASTTVFHVLLKAGTAQDDGTGGAYFQTDGVVYTGIVTIAGTNARYTFTELAPG